MSTQKSEIRWVIVGKHGLYVGQWLTRKDAIYDHVRALYGFNYFLHDAIMKQWKECRAKGDRAIKATVVYSP